MKKTMLGKTGLDVSMIVFGGIIVDGETSDDSARYVSYAIDHGVNYFDVAPSYGNAQGMLGPALAPYRKDVYLACKSMSRDAEGVKAELENSLKTLQTDYFDNYQLHALKTQEDLDGAFAKGGAMEILIQAKEEGILRNIGISAHNEDIAIQALSYYDFDTVLVPINWALNLATGFGDRLIRICKYKNVGILALKSLIERMWLDDDERKAYPKSWCKPIYNEDALAAAAVKYTISKGVDTLVPPGNFEHFSYMVEHIQEYLDHPLQDSDLAFLKERLVGAKDHLLAF